MFSTYIFFNGLPRGILFWHEKCSSQTCNGSHNLHLWSSAGLCEVLMTMMIRVGTCLCKRSKKRSEIKYEIWVTYNYFETQHNYRICLLNYETHKDLKYFCYLINKNTSSMQRKHRKSEMKTNIYVKIKFVDIVIHPNIQIHLSNTCPLLNLNFVRSKIFPQTNNVWRMNKAVVSIQSAAPN